MQADEQRKAGRIPGAYLQRLAATGLILLLAACAGVPDQPANTPGTPVATEGTTQSAPSRPASRPIVQKRGGGYYKDDGPGDNPPPNLADIPDAEPRAEPLRAASNKPYTALGMSFTPMQEVQPFSQRGMASWYGKRFHGAKTSSGEPYDMYSMTGAHPTLPIPSYARVTNVANGKAVVVRINDRGPFHSDRVIDLSYTAAWKLGYADRGSAEVILEAIVPDELDMLIADKTKSSVPFQTLPLDPPTRTSSVASRAPARSASAKTTVAATKSAATAPSAAPVAATTAAVAPTASMPANSDAQTATVVATAQPAPEPTVVAAQTPQAPARRGYFLQLGAFSLNANAESFREHIQHQLKWLRQEIATLLVEGKYRLHVGPFDTASEARSASERIARALNVRPFVVER